ncbi:NADPH-dependent 1-acyldihydroxyacetone phosphate reductase [Lophiotrema nucula]|uniref:NADPH-dependent 1-acyldihydroxyacetone phosphate reductase n=1 Tax=Lophiotrema nucula TaxID=690887 RepID=A0A6A5YLG6_9PLEO|nr:NADPH-dependent 1-acyldihydroxyacetone phosphate reductase [Lophiotrema nucula]
MAPKTVLITGCSTGGIGHALVLEFQRRGHTVFATARSPSKMADLKELPNVHLMALDVVSQVSVDAAVKQVEVKSGGKLDVLVNNAGVLFVMPALDVDIEEARAVFETNYWGVLRVVQAFAPLVIAAKGSILNVGSGAGDLPLPFQSMYNASKAAQNMLSEVLRLELRPLGVKVITLMAGNVATNIAANAPPVEIPQSSVYDPVRSEIGKEMKYSDQPAASFAKQVVDDVLGGSQGKVYRGGNSFIMKWLPSVLPEWAMDYLMLENGRGLKKMPKQ